MTTAHFTEDMIRERGDALLRIRQMERIEETRLRKDMKRSIFREWTFWLGLFAGLGTKNTGSDLYSNGPVIVAMVLFVVALDTAARKRAQALWDWKELQAAKVKMPQV